MADSALVLAIWDVLAGNFRKTAKAIFTTQLMTVAALQHVSLYHHASRALKVLRKLVQNIIRIEILLQQRYHRRPNHLRTLHF